MKQSQKKSASGEPLGDAELGTERTLSFEGAARLLSSRLIEVKHKMVRHIKYAASGRAIVT